MSGPIPPINLSSVLSEVAQQVRHQLAAYHTKPLKDFISGGEASLTVTGLKKTVLTEPLNNTRLLSELDMCLQWMNAPMKAVYPVNLTLLGLFLIDELPDDIAQKLNTLKSYWESVPVDLILKSPDFDQKNTLLLPYFFECPPRYANFSDLLLTRQIQERQLTVNKYVSPVGLQGTVRHTATSKPLKAIISEMLKDMPSEPVHTKRRSHTELSQSRREKHLAKQTLKAKHFLEQTKTVLDPIEAMLKLLEQHASQKKYAHKPTIEQQANAYATAVRTHMCSYCDGLKTAQAKAKLYTNIKAETEKYQRFIGNNHATIVTLLARIGQFIGQLFQSKPKGAKPALPFKFTLKPHRMQLTDEVMRHATVCTASAA